MTETSYVELHAASAFSFLAGASQPEALIERAAQLERRKVTDFCMTALTKAARRTIAEHETIVLSDRDRAVFFDVLVNLPALSERLERAFAEHQRRVVR